MEYTQQVGRIILGDEDLEGLKAFFVKVLSRPHEFKVAMARRCFNLYHALYGEVLSDQDTCEIITDNALLLYAGDFAKSFISFGRFPSLLIFDDILLYGRALYNALYRMEKLICDALEAEGHPVQMRTVHLRMLEATDVMVYAMSDFDDVIDTSYLYKMTCIHHRYGSAILQLSRNISRFLAYCGEANTSHLLSIKLAWTPNEANKAWRRIDWNYGGHRDAALVCEGKDGTLRAIHIFRQGVDGEGQTWATGFPCMMSVPRDALDEFCAVLVQLLDDTGDSDRIKGLLNARAEGYTGFKASLLSLLVSAETLHLYVKDSGMDWKDVLESSDLPRVCLNFGRPKDVWQALSILIYDTRKLGVALDAVRERVSFIDAGKVKDSHTEDSALLRDAENQLCEVGMESEREAFEYSHNLRAFTPLSEDRGVVAFRDYLNTMKNDSDELDCMAIAYELSLLRYGINSLRYDTKTSPQDVECLLKAGELSTHTFPHRHRYVLPALARIEATARASDVPPEQVLNRFVQSIDANECNGLLDEDLLEDLKLHFSRYAGRTYGSSKNMARWNEIYWGDFEAMPSEPARALARIKLSSLLLKKADSYLSDLRCSLPV